MKTEFKHIYFRERDNAPRKTRFFDILNHAQDDLLGEVKWHSPWRQYCFFPEFFPESHTLFSRSCLRDIAEFVDQLMLQRKIIKTSLKDTSISR